jgi:hypothetical protein
LPSIPIASHGSNVKRSPASLNYAYDVSADGQRFLDDNFVEQPGSESIAVTLGWSSELRK